ncbi:MAG: glycosyl hydrolase [Verrucomicrobiia bacterium]
MKAKLYSLLFVLVILVASFTFGESVSGLQKNFSTPPDSARPWVYWFWLNGNISKVGITKDLEAMKEAGIGGVLIMEVDQGVPVGDVDFMSQKWRDLFKHVVNEAQRLGLEVNMNNDAGWNGSGGPWIKPEQSMQKVVWSEVNVEGPREFDETLPQPETVAKFYRDIAVLAFPTVGNYRIENIKAKAAYVRGNVRPMQDKQLPKEMVIERSSITNISALMDGSGRLKWSVPPGKWTIMRFGHTSTGVQNAPAPASGRGLECDKLSPEGIEAQFEGMMKVLIKDVGAAVGKTLVATHIDSWENGSQNWTARMRQEFLNRRKYDLLPFLPVFSGRVVDSLEISERFLWDLRQTINELVVENYAGRMRQLANQYGLRLSIEAYDGPCDDITYAGRADEPMCEFWIGGGAFHTCKEMASAAHIYGKPILGAESFTAGNQEKWLEHPATIKALGDRAFCEGVNRFVFHRYAMQPWEVDCKPGMTMGPWGLHYERTQTWWNWSRPWHAYLSRCQFMLRQGQFVADICYLQPEESPQGFIGHTRRGYDFDNASAEVVIKQMSVKDGYFVLPSGMRYRTLVLPDETRMTPELLRKIKEFVLAGGVVIGNTKPQKAPTLTGYPQCDEEVKKLADELWDSGKIIKGKTVEQALKEMNIPPDFVAPSFVSWIHRRTSDDTDIYFVASNQKVPTEVTCGFRVNNKIPELWCPETGAIEVPAYYKSDEKFTYIPIRFANSGSWFVVFREKKDTSDSIASVSKDGEVVFPPVETNKSITILKATYGVLDDPKRPRDVRKKLQALVDKGELTFQVARMAEGDDPAYGIVKTLIVEYTAGENTLTASGKDPEFITLSISGDEPVVTARRNSGGKLIVETHKAGNYTLKTAKGLTKQWNVEGLEHVQIKGEWEVNFQPNLGAPPKITLPELISWSEHQDTGVKYFSGTAEYRKTFQMPAGLIAKNRRILLDLGEVQIMANVILNGKDLGILWKPPYRVDITEAIKSGENSLQIKVVNLWVNRLIGDQQLPPDSERNPDGTLKRFPEWVLQGKPSPTGRFTFTTWELWKKDSKPVKSGLLGPVKIIPVDVQQL